MSDKANINLDLNDSFQKAYDLMENTPTSVFITGKAGTGKSTLLNYFRNNTKKNIVVLAPTGIAAVNVKGQTIHSFFGFRPNITIESVYRKYDKDDEDNVYAKIDAIVIDEISMVRADLIDCIDKFMRLNGGNINYPFGGVQMIFIGDLFQLPPVVTEEEMEFLGNRYSGPYFFNANVFKNFAMEIVLLDKIYRQKDETFINILNAIRNNSITEEDLLILNKRYLPDFTPSKNDIFMYLTTTNRISDNINQTKLKELDEVAHIYPAKIEGEFRNIYYPTEINLTLKLGAQVMMLNNDSQKRWHNGSMGKIVDIIKHRDADDEVVVEFSNGNIYNIEPFTWDAYEYTVDEETGKVKSDNVGSFTQYPLKLAWSVTIHKSQGQTFDKVIIDIGYGTFAHGQMYVALSRCRSLEGIVLKKRIEKRHVIVDPLILSFSL